VKKFEFFKSYLTRLKPSTSKSEKELEKEKKLKLDI